MGIFNPKYPMLKAKALSKGYILETVKKEPWTNIEKVYATKPDYSSPIKMYK